MTGPFVPRFLPFVPPYGDSRQIAVQPANR